MAAIHHPLPIVADDFLLSKKDHDLHVHHVFLVIDLTFDPTHLYPLCHMVACQKDQELVIVSSGHTVIYVAWQAGYY